MKLPALKQEAYNWYQLLYELTKAYSKFSSPVNDAAFKQEVRGCGDLRRRTTWEKALCRLKARCVVEVAQTGQQLISTYAIRGSKAAGYGELIPQLIDELIATERGLKLIVRGLEKIYRDGGDSETTQEELKEFVDAAKKALERQPTATTQLTPAELRILTIPAPRRA
jgi:hypothetical protein